MSAQAPRAFVDTPSALPVGMRLEEFELRGVLGVGGFGIVYLAFDHVLEREVAVKEYMPAALAGRTQTQHVSLRSQSDAAIFALGLSSFENEAKLLARFDHPSLLKVHRFWKANGTAYMAMPVMRGQTVKEIRQALSAPPAEAWLRNLLDPLLGAVERLHASGVYHRDIAPDNIQIEPDGHPVLLDFGAARRVISEMTQTLTAILKPAYAPIEQYAEVGAVRQGPWTDLYSLGATLHFLMLGRPPPPATARAIHDEPSELTPQALPGISENFLLTVDWMLASRPGDRPQSVAALREVLGGRAEPPRRKAPGSPAASQWDQTVWLPPVPAEDAHLGATETTLPVSSEPDLLLPVAEPPPAPSPPDPRRPREPSFDGPPLDGPQITAPPVAAALTAPPRARRANWLPLGLGAIGLGVAAAVLVLRPGGASTGVPGLAASAAVPGASAASAVAAQPASAQPLAGASSAPPPAPPGMAESHIASVILQPRRSPLETTPAAARPGPDSRTGAAPPATRAQAESHPGETQATFRPAGGLAAAASSVAAPASHPPSALPAAGPLQPTASPAVPATVHAASAEAPEATCAGLSVFQHFVCMERECLKPNFRSHPDCLAWHHIGRQ